MPKNGERPKKYRRPSNIKSQQFVCSTREKPNRIVATVLPFTEYQQQVEEYSEERESDDVEVSDKPDDKKHIWNTLCLQESGIFEGDPPEYNSQGTQTDPFFPETPGNKALDLTAEIQKLNQFRESIEVGNKAKKLLVSSDQKYLKEINFYKDRLDVLEKKLQIYESSGDIQAKRLAERLSREVYLASQVKDLSSKVQKLHAENSRLEEERCELEEAENDTRLRCQQLEAEIEALSDRLKAMEDSKLAAKRKAKDAKSQANYWESMVKKYEERTYELEEKECEMRHRLEVMECTTPAILLFNMWKVMQNNPDLDMKDILMDKLKDVGRASRSESRSPQRCMCENAVEDVQNKIKSLESERNNLMNQKENVENKVRDLEQELTTLRSAMQGSWGDQHSKLSIQSSDIEIIKELEALTEKEKQMKKRITELEHREMAYMETLQQADEIWAEMESSYKKRIGDAEESEHNLRQKLQKYEQSDERDERIQELEETEKALNGRVARLEKEVQRLLNTNKGVKEELESCLCNYQEKLDSAHAKYAGDIDREKKKCSSLSEELKTTQKLKAEAGKAYEAEIESLKNQLSKTRKELVHLDVTNSELREEVYTLESKISELEKEMSAQRARDSEAIKGLSRELKTKDRELAMMKNKSEKEEPGVCAEEEIIAATLQPEVSLNEMARRLSSALKSVERCVECAEAATPDLMQTVDGIKSLCEQMECQGPGMHDAPKVSTPTRFSSSAARASFPTAFPQTISKSIVSPRASQLEGVQVETNPFPKPEAAIFRIPSSCECSEIISITSPRPPSQQMRPYVTQVAPQTPSSPPTLNRASLQRYGSLTATNSASKVRQMSGDYTVRQPSAQFSSRQSTEIQNIQQNSQYSTKQQITPTEMRPQTSETTNRTPVFEAVRPQTGDFNNRHPSYEFGRSSCGGFRAPCLAPDVYATVPSITAVDDCTCGPTSLSRPPSAIHSRASAQFNAPSTSASPLGSQAALTSTRASGVAVAPVYTLPPTKPKSVDQTPVAIAQAYQTQPSVPIPKFEALASLQTETFKIPIETAHTEIQMIEGKVPDALNIRTFFTGSGNLEITTEGPPGHVETTMMMTPSGNMELLTEFTTDQDEFPPQSYFRGDREPTGPDIGKQQPSSGAITPKEQEQQAEDLTSIAETLETAEPLSPLTGSIKSISRPSFKSSIKKSSEATQKSEPLSTSASLKSTSKPSVDLSGLSEHLSVSMEGIEPTTASIKTASKHSTPTPSMHERIKSTASREMSTRAETMSKRSTRSSHISGLVSLGSQTENVCPASTSEHISELSEMKSKMTPVSSKVDHSEKGTKSSSSFGQSLEEILAEVSSSGKITPIKEEEFMHAKPKKEEEKLVKAPPKSVSSQVSSPKPVSVADVESAIEVSSKHEIEEPKTPELKESLSKPPSPTISIERHSIKSPLFTVSAEGFKVVLPTKHTEIQTEEGKIPEGLNIMTMFTPSGHLEVVTEGPPGIIETTMTMSPSGNVKLQTDFTMQMPALGDLHPALKQPEALPQKTLTSSITSATEKLATPVASQPSTLADSAIPVDMSEKNISRTSTPTSEKSIGKPISEPLSEDVLTAAASEISKVLSRPASAVSRTSSKSTEIQKSTSEASKISIKEPCGDITSKVISKTASEISKTSTKPSSAISRVESKASQVSKVPSVPVAKVCQALSSTASKGSQVCKKISQISQVPSGQISQKSEQQTRTDIPELSKESTKMASQSSQVTSDKKSQSLQIPSDASLKLSKPASRAPSVCSKIPSKISESYQVASDEKTIEDVPQIEPDKISHVSQISSHIISSTSKHASDKISEIGKMASEKISEIEKLATENISDKITNASKTSSQRISEATKQASEKISEVTKVASEKISEITKLISEAIPDETSYLSKTSSQRISEASKHVSERISEVTKVASEKISEISKLASERVSEISKLASERVSEISKSISDKKSDTAKISSDIPEITTEDAQPASKTASEISKTTREESPEIVQPASRKVSPISEKISIKHSSTLSSKHSTGAPCSVCSVISGSSSSKSEKSQRSSDARSIKLGDAIKDEEPSITVDINIPEMPAKGDVPSKPSSAIALAPHSPRSVEKEEEQLQSTAPVAPMAVAQVTVSAVTSKHSSAAPSIICSVIHSPASHSPSASFSDFSQSRESKGSSCTCVRSASWKSADRESQVSYITAQKENSLEFTEENKLVDKRTGISISSKTTSISKQATSRTSDGTKRMSWVGVEETTESEENTEKAVIGESLETIPKMGSIKTGSFVSLERSSSRPGSKGILKTPSQKMSTESSPKISSATPEESLSSTLNSSISTRCSCSHSTRSASETSQEFTSVQQSCSKDSNMETESYSMKNSEPHSSASTVHGSLRSQSARGQRSIEDSLATTRTHSDQKISRTSRKSSTERHKKSELVENIPMEDHPGIPDIMDVHTESKTTVDKTEKSRASTKSITETLLEPHIPDRMDEVCICIQHSCHDLHPEENEDLQEDVNQAFIKAQDELLEALSKTKLFILSVVEKCNKDTLPNRRATGRTPACPRPTSAPSRTQTTDRAETVKETRPRSAQPPNDMRIMQGGSRGNVEGWTESRYVPCPGERGVRPQSYQHSGTHFYQTPDCMAGYNPTYGMQSYQQQPFGASYSNQTYNAPITVQNVCLPGSCIPTAIHQNIPPQQGYGQMAGASYQPVTCTIESRPGAAASTSYVSVPIEMDLPVYGNVESSQRVNNMECVCDDLQGTQQQNSPYVIRCRKIQVPH